MGTAESRSRSGFGRRGIGFGLAALIVTATACSSSTDRAANRPPSTTASTKPRETPRETRCSHPSVFGAEGAPNEVHGASADGQVWGLALGPGHVPPRVGDELKIVWRVTGTGPLRVMLTAPDGGPRALEFGPEAHAAGSTFARPGDEWGTGFRFTTRGCWHIQLARTNTAGDVWLEVETGS